VSIMGGTVRHANAGVKHRSAPSIRFIGILPDFPNARIAGSGRAAAARRCVAEPTPLDQGVTR